MKNNDYFVLCEDGYDCTYLEAFFPNTTLDEVLLKLSHNNTYSIYSRDFLEEKYSKLELNSKDKNIKKRNIEFSYNSGKECDSLDDALSKEDISFLRSKNIYVTSKSNFSNEYCVQIQDIATEARSKLSKQEYEAFKAKVIRENIKS